MGFTLRDLACEVGVRQPSLYEYFASKDALYDAMFADGNRQLLAALAEVDHVDGPRAALKSWVRHFAAFAVADAARAELLFQRHAPGFPPSEESYALAQEALGQLVALAEQVGVADRADVDCLAAMIGGVVEAPQPA